MTRFIQVLFASTFLLFGSFGQTLTAQNNYVITTTNDASQSANGGYVPFEITIQTLSSKPVTYDTQFNVCMVTGYWSNQNLFSAPLVIKAGTVAGSAKIRVLLDQNNHDCTWWVEKDNNLKYDRFDLVQRGLNLNYSSMVLDSQCFLFVSSTVPPATRAKLILQNGKVSDIAGGRAGTGKDLPSLDSLCQLMPNASATVQSNFGGLNQQLALNSSIFRTTSPIEIPTNWVDLSSIQQMFISLDDLKTLAPSQMSALRKWTAAGGRLVVNRCGDGCANALSILKTMEIPILPKPNWHWLTPAAYKHLGDTTHFVYIDSTETGRQSRIDLDYFSASPSARNRLFKQGAEGFWKSTDSIPGSNPDVPGEPKQSMLCTYYGQGSITAVDADMTQWKKKDWAMLMTTLEMAGPDFSTLIGKEIVSGTMINAKIPGVREPPKSAFQLLIICFVLVAGPLNYAVLKRARRLNVLLLTVPLISLIACFSLFVYAFLVQGFGTKVRHDSLTFIDQRNEVAVNRSMHTVFSGLHPGSHVFPDDSLVFVAKSSDSSQRSQVRFEDNQMAFSGGLIQPRTPHQLSVINTFPTKEGIRFMEKDNELIVRSDFKNEILALTFRRNGQLYQVQNIAPGSTEICKIVLEEDARAIQKSLINDLTDEPNIQRRFTNFGINNQIVVDASLSALERPDTYLAVFKDYEGAAPLNDHSPSSGGVHVVLGRF